MIIFNPAQFRADFPALATGAVYLDSAATALKPTPVINATDDYYRHVGGNVHRSQYRAAQRLTTEFENARQRVADFIHATHSESIIWTRGTTESINMVAQCYFRDRVKPGDELLVSEAEHHANLVPWLMLAQQTGCKVVKLPIDSHRLPDLSQLPHLLNNRTKLLAIGQMSNVTGGMPCLDEAIHMAHQVGAKVMVDGAQGIVHQATDVSQLDVDFYAFSGHKLYGPTGIGVLYAKASLLEVMSPWQGGGKMIDQVSFEGFVLQSLPYRLEAGTPNVAGVIGLNAALTWLETLDRNNAEAWSISLAERAEYLLSQRRGFRSLRSPGSSLLSFNFAGVHHHDLVTLLSESGIALRAGQHCAQPLLSALGEKGTLRASFAPYNDQSDVEKLTDAIDRALFILED